MNIHGRQQRDSEPPQCGCLLVRRTVTVTHIEQLTDCVLLAAVRTEHLHIDQHGVRAKRELIGTVESRKGVVGDCFQSTFEPLDRFTIVGKPFGRRPTIGWRRHLEIFGEVGVNCLMGDEISAERVDIDVHTFESSTRLGLHPGAHRVVSQQSVGVFGLPCKRVEPSVSHYCSEQCLVEPIGERPQALAFVALAAPPVCKLVANPQIVLLDHPSNLRHHPISPPKAANTTLIVRLYWAGYLYLSARREHHGNAQMPTEQTWAMALSLIERLRQPAYTGERRCWPCTLLNLVLVAIAAAGTGLVSVPAAVLIGATGVALIALRGYVVPYTPMIAPKLTAWVPFDIGPSTINPRSDSLLAVDDPERLLTVLVAAGVVVEDGELFLDAAVERAWEQRMDGLREKSDAEVAFAVAEAVPFPADSLVSNDRLLLAGEHNRDVWLTRPVAIASAAGIDVLVEHGVDRQTAAAAVDPLRLFLQHCPDCGDPVVESTVHNCCGGTKGVYDHPERDVLACSSCDAVLYEFPLAESTPTN